MHRHVPIIGIDPSSKKLAITITERSDQRVPEMMKFRLPENHIEGAGVAFRRISEILSRYVASPVQPRIYQEDQILAGSRNVRGSIVQAFVAGGVGAAAGEFGCYMEFVNNMTWKAQEVGNGHASKAQIGEWLEENWPEAWEMAEGDEDLIDSAVINLHGQRNYRVLRAVKLGRVLRAA